MSESETTGGGPDRVLVIEGALAPGGAALLRRGRIAAAASAARGADLQPDLFRAVREVLGRGGVPAREIEGIAVGRGPGSFTGTRVALAIARALRLAVPGVRRLAGLDTAELLARAAGIGPPLGVAIPWGRRRVLLVDVPADAPRRARFAPLAGLRQAAPLSPLVCPQDLASLFAPTLEVVPVAGPGYRALARLVAEGRVAWSGREAGAALEPAYWAPSDAVLPRRRPRLPEGMRIVELGPSHLDEVLVIERESFSDPWSPAMLAGELAPSPDRLAIGVRDAEGGLVAFALARVAAGEMNILVVAVRSRARRRGLGRALVRELLSRGRAMGVERVDLEVRVSNREAIALYEREGFARVGRRAAYYRDGEDALLMSCVLARPAAGGGAAGGR